MTVAETQKTCGACSFCCKVLGIAELNKPLGVWCSHAKPGKGCDIYGSHPHSCQVFACQWLYEPGLAESFRPDRSKVMLTAAEGPVLIADCEPNNPVAWRREPMYGLLKHRARTHWGGVIAVMARAGTRMWQIAPDQDIDLGLVDPRSPLQFDRMANGEVRVVVLPPLSEEEVAAQLADYMRPAEERVKS